MDSVDVLFHYIVTRLAVLPYKIWRGNTPDGYGVCFKLGSLELLFDRSDINTLVRLEESYCWGVSSDLHEHLAECLEDGVGFSNVLKMDGKEGMEVGEVNTPDISRESELIANCIMISVQSNKYGINVYNTERTDFNHYHLQMAARKGIEFGLKAVLKGKGVGE